MESIQAMCVQCLLCIRHCSGGWRIRGKTVPQPSRSLQSSLKVSEKEKPTVENPVSNAFIFQLRGL